MATQQTESDRHGQPDGRQAVKRRGLIAGAAALVAGIIAKQAAQPVAANDSVWTFPYTGTTTTPINQAAMSITNLGNASDGMFVLASRVGLSGSGGEVGVQGSGSGTTNNTSGAGVVGVGGNPDGDGMHGTGVGSGVGVSGESPSGTGVSGQSSGGGSRRRSTGNTLRMAMGCTARRWPAASPASPVTPTAYSGCRRATSACRARSSPTRRTRSR